MREPDPRWIVDEMLGRLSRYLRFLGYDTLYAHGIRDDQILEIVREEGRWLVTRDRDLARRAPSAFLLHRFDLQGQLEELQALYPSLRTEVRFLRCPLCNGMLVASERSRPRPPKDVPERLWASSVPIYECQDCGQSYWEGSHTEEIRRTLARLQARRTSRA
jgi:uncharacterized protein with PIN domain